ncbi:chymotrypsin B isoform X1 [Galendromus occidentalis]|uniref:Chymotrypsin B isoform X1 n=1 Tax=Galendromus occidentalis TaxID=34638 RepID=A0AAJ6VYU3_9ACAR|nr:chymotrypsin B isoform X1 [Galendromus occidentalis]
MVESMRYLIAFGFLATAVGQECGVPNDASAYIVGGDAARRLEFPWQISLQKFENGVWSHTCGGSIIDKNWVLTAAHCVDYRFQGLEPLRVVAGEHDLTKNEGTEIYFAVNRRRGDIAIHPQWDSDIVDYDYALIQLDRPLNFTGAQSRLAPICLPTPADATTFDGMTCVGSGWGVTKRNGDKRHVPALLQKVVFKIPPHQRCVAAWLRGGVLGGAVRLTPRHICAASVQGEDHGVCNGDSGGPLQCFTKNNRWTLAGVASFVKYCGSAAYPDVYARTTLALDWIERVKRVRTRNA